MGKENEKMWADFCRAGDAPPEIPPGHVSEYNYDSQAWTYAPFPVLFVGQPDDGGGEEAEAGIEEVFFTTPFCQGCGHIAACGCEAPPARREKLTQLREAMIRELRRSGYTVTAPGPAIEA